ncbi:MAG: prepilin peptidase [Candidatus Sabulitectum sp.]|nr:prepilin peptidase [Candidatus Sabulitectum sp.]
MLIILTLYGTAQVSHEGRYCIINIDNIFTVFAGLFGLSIGSFLNVVVWRVPLGRSIVSPPSACPGCGKEIEPVDNIPVVSYLLLRGKCRNCSMKISVKYPITELVTGILFTLAALHTGYSLPFISYAVLIALMVVVVRTDLEQFIILDEVSVGGAVAGILLALLPGGLGILTSLITAVAGALFFLLIRAGASIYLKKKNIRTEAPEGFEDEEEEFQGGMGWGDIKLAACIGAFLGPASTVIAFFAAFILGAISGGAMMVFGGKKRNTPIPFGPFMAVGAALALFYGEPLWNVYMNLLG